MGKPMYDYVEEGVLIALEGAAPFRTPDWVNSVVHLADRKLSKIEGTKSGEQARKFGETFAQRVLQLEEEITC